MHVCMLTMHIHTSKPRSRTCRSLSHNGKCLLATVPFHIHFNHPHFISLEYKFVYYNRLLYIVKIWFLKERD